MRRSARKRVLRAVVLACALSGTASGSTEMTVTIDDLPTHGALPQRIQRLTIAEQIISVLRRHAVPEVYVFVRRADTGPSGVHGHLDDMAPGAVCASETIPSLTPI